MKEWTTPDSRNTPSTTNLEEEEIVDAPGNDGNASMPEQVKRPNQWRKMMMMMIQIEKKTNQRLLDIRCSVFAKFISIATRVTVADYICKLIHAINNNII